MGWSVEQSRSRPAALACVRALTRAGTLARPAEISQPAEPAA
jgi:hypothetical protein